MDHLDVQSPPGGRSRAGSADMDISEIRMVGLDDAGSPHSPENPDSRFGQGHGIFGRQPQGPGAERGDLPRPGSPLLPDAVLRDSPRGDELATTPRRGPTGAGSESGSTEAPMITPKRKWNHKIAKPPEKATEPEIAKTLFKLRSEYYSSVLRQLDLPESPRFFVQRKGADACV